MSSSSRKLFGKIALNKNAFLLYLGMQLEQQTFPR